MRVILSRKGWDTQTGKKPSPILPDGTLLSMPIPTDVDVDQLTDFPVNIPSLNWIQTYDDVRWDLNRNLARNGFHADPDIGGFGRKELIEKTYGLQWRPAFGQGSQGLGQLSVSKPESYQVEEGDLFLFFGLFQPTTVDRSKKKLSYNAMEQRVHAIYGYMQVDRIMSGNAIAEEFPWHPHALPRRLEKGDSNKLFTARSKLSLPGIDEDLSGWGTFDYAESRILTKRGVHIQRRNGSKTKNPTHTAWKLYDWMKEAKISQLSAEWRLVSEEGYFNANVRSKQEFIILRDVEDFPALQNWLREVFLS